MINNVRFYIISLLTVASLHSFAQQASTQVNNLQQADSNALVLQQLPSNYYSKVDKKISNANNQLTKKSLKYLGKFQKQENKLQQKLAKLNTDSTKNVLANATEKYNELSQQIKSKATGVTKLVGAYNPYLDSLGTSLNFLKQFTGTSGKVTGPLQSFNDLQNKLQQSEKIQAFIADRQSQIKQLLSSYTNLPAGLKNEYDKINKTAYYYKAQVQEYKDMLKDEKKIEQQALTLLNKLPAFQKFVRQNSQLASLFRIPDASSTGINQAALTGLQTRSSVQTLIQQRIASGGPNAQSQIQQNIAEAQAELTQLKDKINQFTGGGGGNADMPGFKPNNQKTKPLLKRLEYAANIQFDKSTSLLPSDANIGLGIGYKLNDKSTIGVGMSYKFGMGTLKHISFTSQGLGLRSYMDWQIKKQIYVSGGYEMNYNSVFKNIEQLKNYDAWQRSALIGLSKKYKISKKVQGNMQLLYDFLANTNIPVTSPIVFRLGYNF